MSFADRPSSSTNVLIIKVALPVVGALALEPVMSLIDTYYVGKYLGKPRWWTLAAGHVDGSERK